MSFEPGWYPDPMQRYEHRYYDGSSWTEHVATGGTQAVDPVEGASPGTAATLPDAGDATPTSTSDSVDTSDLAAPADTPGAVTPSAPEIRSDQPLTTTTAISAAQAAAELAELQSSATPVAEPTETEPVETAPDVAQEPVPTPPAAVAPEPEAIPDPVAAPAATAPPAASVAQAGGALVLPDDPEGAPTRRLWGILMMAAAGLVVFSLLLPWVSGNPAAAVGNGPHTVSGFEWMYAWIAAATAVGMGFYGLQGVKRSRVRFHVLALLGILFLLSATFGGTLDPDENAREQLGVQQRQRVVSQNILGGGAPTTTTTGENVVETEPGLWIALVAGLGMIAPLVVLWRDDRRRRAGLLAAGAAATGVTPGAAPRPQSPDPAAIQPPPPDPATIQPPAPDPATIQASTAPAPGAADPSSAPPGSESEGPATAAGTPVEAPEPESPTVAADWYRDPTGRFEMRYFDGHTWTEHVAQSGAQTVDPTGGANAAPPSLA